MTPAASAADTPFLFGLKHPALRFIPRGRCIAASALLGLALAGCAPRVDLDALDVLNYSQCNGVAAGLTLVAYSDLARIRGGELVSPGTDPQGLDQSVLLVALSRGAQPSAGYQMSLGPVVRVGSTAEITIEWHGPEPGQPVAQVVTHPCLVAAFPRTGLNRVTVRDQTGATIGTMDLP